MAFSRHLFRNILLRIHHPNIFVKSIVYREEEKKRRLPSVRFWEGTTAHRLPDADEGGFSSHELGRVVDDTTTH